MLHASFLDLHLFSYTDTSRFSGAQHHLYLLNVFNCVANRYHYDGRAGDLVMDLLKLKVPKLFAVEQGGEKDKEVCHKFSSFLQSYICRNALKRTILEKINNILVSEANSHVLYMQMSEPQIPEMPSIIFLPLFPF